MKNPPTNPEAPSALNAVIFEGNAPSSMGSQILHRTTNATLYFYEGAEGFSTPTWLAENYPCAMLPMPADSFRAWASGNGIDASGLSVADFFVASGSNGIPNAFSYAYGKNLQPGDSLLELSVMDNKLFLETPKQLSSTTNGVLLSIVATTNLMDHGVWTLGLADSGQLAGDPPSRMRVEVDELPLSDNLFFRLKARLLP